MDTVDENNLEQLTEKVIGCGIAVHREFGPGLLESVYQACMLIELAEAQLEVEADRPIALKYRGKCLTQRLTLDLVVDNCLIIEIKAVERLHPVHLAQVMTYLKLTGYPAGLLMNFNVTALRGGLKRLVHPDLYVKKSPTAYPNPRV